MDRDLVYATDFWIDHKDENRHTIWFEVYREISHSGKYQFKYYVEKCLRKHEDHETYNFNDPLYCLTYLDEDRIHRSSSNNVIYNEPAAIKFAHEKIRLLRKRKTVGKLIEREEFIYKLEKTGDFFNKYTEE